MPGGSAVLPSTALMLGIPAQVAGCKEVILATPPKQDGSVSLEVLYIAKKVGVSKLLLAGKLAMCSTVPENIHPVHTAY